MFGSVTADHGVQVDKEEYAVKTDMIFTASKVRIQGTSHSKYKRNFLLDLSGKCPAI